MRREVRRGIYFLAVALGLCFLAGLLQTSFFPALGLLGAVPDLTLILVAGVAFWLGSEAGGLVGLVGGIVLEGLAGSGLALAPLAYTVLGLVCGFAARKFLGQSFLHITVFYAATCGVKAVYSVACILLASPGVIWQALWASVVPEWVLTLVLALALTVPVKAAAGLLRGRLGIRKGKGGRKADE